MARAGGARHDAGVTEAAPARSRDAALRLVAFYVASFAALGVWVSFWPLWLAHQGCSEAQVGLLGTALIVARTFAGPLWAQRADRGSGPRPTLRLLATLSLLSFLPFGLGGGFAPFLVWTVAFGVCYPPMHPLIDSLTLSVGRERGLPYGRVRLWGSLSFLVVTVAAGMAIERHGPALVWWIVLGSLALTAGSSARLPVAAAPPPRATGRPILELLRSPPFLLLLASVGTIMASHAAFYTYGAIHWHKAGIAEGTIGWLVAEGVLAEILLFRLAAPVVARVRPSVLLMLGGLGGCVRWTVLGTTTALPALVAVQWLHALTFGCVHLGALQWITRRVAPDRTTTAQGLLAAVSSGLCSALATALAAAWYPAHGGSVFLAMAGLAALGGAAALGLYRTAVPGRLSVP